MESTEIIEGESRLIRAEAPTTCGNCKYGLPFREGLVVSAAAVECHGVPPTPVVMGQGMQGIATGLLRARLAKTEPGCALWKLKLQVLAA